MDKTNWEVLKFNQIDNSFFTFYVNTITGKNTWSHSALEAKSVNSSFS